MRWGNGLLARAFPLRKTAPRRGRGDCALNPRWVTFDMYSRLLLFILHLSDFAVVRLGPKTRCSGHGAAAPGDQRRRVLLLIGGETGAVGRLMDGSDFLRGTALVELKSRPFDSDPARVKHRRCFEIVTVRSESDSPGCVPVQSGKNLIWTVSF
jgi:hypothetical protein